MVMEISRFWMNTVFFPISNQEFSLFRSLQSSLSPSGSESGRIYHFFVDQIPFLFDGNRGSVTPAQTRRILLLEGY